MFKFGRLSSLNFLYLSIFSFVFIASFALSLNKAVRIRTPRIEIINEISEREKFPSLPVLKKYENAPELTAESILALDVNSGVVLYQKNPDELLFPASTTKMLTALTALDYYNLDDLVTIKGINVQGQKMKLQEGEQISVRDLIQGLLIYSANDAAEALAQKYCVEQQEETLEPQCGRDLFIKAMNIKAKSINMDSTHFVNPTGLDNEGHLTTARDLSRLAIEGMKNPLFREIVGTKETTVISIDGNIRHKLTNLNQLLGEVTGVLGIKTGWTENAKENLVTFMDRDNNDIVIVLLKSDDRFGETKQIINWIYDNYEWKKVSI